MFCVKPFMGFRPSYPHNYTYHIHNQFFKSKQTGDKEIKKEIITINPSGIPTLSNYYSYSSCIPLFFTAIKFTL